MKKFQFALALAISVQQIVLPKLIAWNTNLSSLPISVTRESLRLNVAATEKETFSSNQPWAITLHSLNPGYTIDGIQNVGEFIELRNLTGSPVSLTGYTLRYTNATGNRSNLYVFPEGSTMVGESLLLRLASSPESSQSDLSYTKTLALAAGPLELVYQDEVVESVCWTGKSGCLDKFINQDGRRTALVKDQASGTFSHQTDYSPQYDPERPGYQAPVLPAEENVPIEPQCRGLEFSELYTYYVSNQSEQFIELYNSTEQSMPLDGCQIKYKTKTLSLAGTLAAGAYYFIAPDFALTKNPTKSNTYELLDVTGDVIDTLVLPKGQKSSASYAYFGLGDDGKEEWLITYLRTPGEPNEYQQFRSCPEGKIINVNTGNCVKAATIQSLSDCPAGKYRNPTTGRCKSYETSTTKECKEGYERNPETNRCRKIKKNDGAAYPLVPKTASEKTTFVAFLAVVAVVLVGLAYIIYQYRQELGKLICRLLRLPRHRRQKNRQKKS